MSGLPLFVLTFTDTSSSFMAVHQLVTVMDTSSMDGPPFAALKIISGYKDEWAGIDPCYVQFSALSAPGELNPDPKRGGVSVTN
jgi:hypothetical protein